MQCTCSPLCYCPLCYNFPLCYQLLSPLLLLLSPLLLLLSPLLLLLSPLLLGIFRNFPLLLISVTLYPVSYHPVPSVTHHFLYLFSSIMKIFSCDQAALQMVFSVCLSVRLSVTPFWLCSHHQIIMKFSGVITNDQRKVHAKGQGQRSKVKVTEVTTQLNRFRTVTPVWIHIWWWYDAYSLMLLRRGALLFFKVIRQISRSHGSKNRRIWPRLGVSGL